MPLAFFCTLFFRHRKKSVSAPWDGQSQSAPESARQAPTGESLCGASRGLSARPLHPFGSPPEAIGRPIGLQALSPRRSRRVRPHRGRGLRLRAHWGLSARPQSPSGRSWRKTPRGINIPAEKQGGFSLAPLLPSGRNRRKTQKLSSGQTIGASRTAVRPACCLPAPLRPAPSSKHLYPKKHRSRHSPATPVLFLIPCPRTQACEDHPSCSASSPAP